MSAVLDAIPPPLVWATASLMCLSAWGTALAVAWLDRHRGGR